jgi:conjugative transposon TraK protein
LPVKGAPKPVKAGTKVKNIRLRPGSDHNIDCKIDGFGAMALKEKGFYNNLIGTSTICSIFCDSIRLNKDSLTFTYYGRQRIERRTNILMRQIVTAGNLKKVPRTENNPHGILITNWRTLLNKDLEEKKKSEY